MSQRRNQPANRWGCKPEEDVCVEHDEPLKCKHGCSKAKDHECKQLGTRRPSRKAGAPVIQTHQ